MRPHFSQHDTLPAGQNSDSVSWLIPIILSCVLVVASFYHFPVFHVLAEFFAIIIAVTMAVVAWQMYPFTRNNYLMYLGCGYFWIAALDVVHVLIFKGMGIFPVSGGNPGTQFWIAARYLESFVLLSAPYFLNHSFNVKGVFWFLGSTAFLLFVVITSGLFPDCYIDGVGLTPFKVVSEYVVILIIALAAYVLWHRRHLLEQKFVELMLYAMLLTTLSEVAFTLYRDVHGLFSMIGHILRLYSQLSQSPVL